MNKKGKLFALILSLALVISFVPTNIFAEGAEPSPTPTTPATEYYNVTFKYNAEYGEAGIIDGENYTKVDSDQTIQVAKGEKNNVIGVPEMGCILICFRIGNNEMTFPDFSNRREITPEGDIELEIDFEQITMTAEADLKNIDFGRVKVGYEEFDTRDIIITNTGNFPLVIFKPNPKYYDVVTFKNPVGPVCLTDDEEGIVDDLEYLRADETVMLSIRPKNGLAVGKYDETLSVKAIAEPLGDTELPENLEEVEGDLFVDVDLKFEVYEESKPEPKPTPAPEKQPEVVIPNTATKTK